MSNSLDPVQERQNVVPDLGLNCFQRLSADNTSRQRVWMHVINLFLLLQMPGYVQNLKPVQYCTGYTSCSFQAVVYL